MKSLVETRANFDPCALFGLDLSLRERLAVRYAPTFLWTNLSHQVTG